MPCTTPKLYRRTRDDMLALQPVFMQCDIANPSDQPGRMVLLPASALCEARDFGDSEAKTACFPRETGTGHEGYTVYTNPPKLRRLS
jgi:hypothetical protein